MLDSIVPAGRENGHRESKMMAKETLTLFACLLSKELRLPFEDPRP